MTDTLLTFFFLLRQKFAFSLFQVRYRRFGITAQELFKPFFRPFFTAFRSAHDACQALDQDRAEQRLGRCGRCARRVLRDRAEQRLGGSGRRPDGLADGAEQRLVTPDGALVDQ